MSAVAANSEGKISEGEDSGKNVQTAEMERESSTWRGIKENLCSADGNDPRSNFS